MNVPATTEAAIPLPEGQIPRLLPVDLLQPGRLQPRKRFNQAKLQELADSIKRQGVAQHILVRPVEDGPGIRLEIVCGERRWRACKIAGLTAIPAIQRTLTDSEALEIAVIENDQREDLHPLEQAEGYEALLKVHGHEATNEQSADDLAKKIGKSRTFVYNRLKLLALVPDARDAFYDGTLVTTLAEKIARLPIHQQTKALKAIMKDGECMPVREAQALLRRDFMLRLNTAPFSTGSATLLPEAGACKTCHKRTGHEPDLFADVEHNDTCTDPPCYHLKVAANNAQLKAKATKAGVEVIEGDNARALLKFGTTSDTLNGDYVYMDQPLANLTGTDKPLKKLLGKDLKPSALFEHPKDNTLREIVQVTKATDALRDAGLLLHDPEAGRAAKKAGQHALLDTSVATPRDKPEGAINTKIIQMHSGGPSEPAPAPAVEDDSAPSSSTPQGEGQYTEADVLREWVWREQAFVRIHDALHDKGHDPAPTLRKLVVLRLAGHITQKGWELLASLWGFDVDADVTDTPNPMALAIEGMDNDQLDLLMAELVVLADVYPQGWALNSGMATAAESGLAHACADPEIAVDWLKLSKAPYPPQSPPPAGDDKGAPAEDVADKPATQDDIQAPQGAQSNEPAQPAPLHWVGQFVQIKGAKGTWSIRSIDGNGDIHVIEQGGSMRGTRRIVAHEAKVLPGQTCPAHKESAHGNRVGQKVSIKDTKRTGEVRELLPNGMVLVAIPVKGQDHASLEGFAPSQLESVKGQRIPPHVAWPFPTGP